MDDRPLAPGGHGEAASLEDLQHGDVFRQDFGEEFANQLRILYGGSVKPDNAHALMTTEGIDGALVGGASLDPKSFAAIVKY